MSIFEQEQQDSVIDQHAIGFDSGVIKREGKTYMGKIYLGALKTMAVSSLVLGLEQFYDHHNAIKQPYQNPVPYIIPVYTSWNANMRELWKDPQTGWKLKTRVDRKKYTTKDISVGRVHAILNMMKKRTAKGFSMLTAKGGAYEEAQSTSDGSDSQKPAFRPRFE